MDNELSLDCIDQNDKLNNDLLVINQIAIDDVSLLDQNTSNLSDKLEVFDIIDNDNTNHDNNTLLYNENLCHEIKLLKMINQIGMPLNS